MSIDINLSKYYKLSGGTLFNLICLSLLAIDQSNHEFMIIIGLFTWLKKASYFYSREIALLINLFTLYTHSVFILTITKQLQSFLLLGTWISNLQPGLNLAILYSKTPFHKWVLIPTLKLSNSIPKNSHISPQV